MATLVTRTVVCDEGLDRCDNTTLVKVQLAVDGKKAAKILCRKHAAPYVKMLEQLGGSARPKRGRVYTEAEIAAARKK